MIEFKNIQCSDNSPFIPVVCGSSLSKLNNFDILHQQWLIFISGSTKLSKGVKSIKSKYAVANG